MITWKVPIDAMMMIVIMATLLVLSKIHDGDDPGMISLSTQFHHLLWYVVWHSFWSYCYDHCCGCPTTGTVGTTCVMLYAWCRTGIMVSVQQILPPWMVRWWFESIRRRMIVLEVRVVLTLVVRYGSGIHGIVVMVMDSNRMVVVPYCTKRPGILPLTYWNESSTFYSTNTTVISVLVVRSDLSQS